MFDSLSHALEDDEIETIKKKKIEQEEKTTGVEEKKEIKSTDVIEIITNNQLVSLSKEIFLNLKRLASK
jgi:hypothetical protein